MLICLLLTDIPTPAVKRISRPPGEIDSLSKKNGPQLQLSSLIGLLQGKDKETRKLIAMRKPFMEAVEARKVKAASRYLAAGVNIDVVIKGWTALGKAAYNNDVAMARTLIKEGANLNLEASRRTPLCWAVEKELSAMTYLLLECGSDIRDHTFMVAVKRGDKHIVNAMLDGGANASSRDEFGETALHHTVQHGILGVMRLLIAKGADLNSINQGGIAQKSRIARKDGITVLMKAVDCGQMKAVCLLLDGGADIEGKALNSRTCLMRVASAGKMEVVKLLLDKGANIETQDKCGWTALLHATKDGQTQIVKNLLDEGADKDARDFYGKTALIRAAEGGHQEIVKLLLENGAEVSTKSNKGETAIDKAKQRRDSSITTMLRDAGA